VTSKISSGGSRVRVNKKTVYHTLLIYSPAKSGPDTVIAASKMTPPFLRLRRKSAGKTRRTTHANQVLL
jgi:hypothetical protein